MWLMATLGSVAWGATALTGDSGVLLVPTADTLPKGQVVAAIGLMGTRGWDGPSLVGVPAGLAMGAPYKLELGARMERDSTHPIPDLNAMPAFGGHMRRRLVDASGWRPSVAVQASVHGLTLTPHAQLLAISSWESWRYRFTTSLGPRTPGENPAAMWGGTALEVHFGKITLMTESSATLAQSVISDWGVRGGARAPLRSRFLVTGWAGAGQLQASPWVAGGLAVSMHSVDPFDQDQDWDKVPDYLDHCRYVREDHDSYQDEDGCPELDNDNDGIPDTEDETPNGERSREKDRYQAPYPLLKMRIKPRKMPGPIEAHMRNVNTGSDGESALDPPPPTEEDTPAAMSPELDSPDGDGPALDLPPPAEPGDLIEPQDGPALETNEAQPDP